MEKGILIVNMPNRCKDCSLSEMSYSGFDRLICVPMGESVYKFNKSKPNWCPIKTIPSELNELDVKKQAIFEDCYDGTDLEDWYISGKVRGWNSLLEALLNQTDI